MTETQVTDLLAAFNQWLEESGSTLRMTWPDGELIAQVVEADLPNKQLAENGHQDR